MKALTTFILIVGAFLAAGQDTAYYYTMGTQGKDHSVYGVETKQGFTIFGNTGEVGKGSSEMYVIQMNDEFEVDSFKALGTAANEKIVDGVIDSMGRHLILSSYYDGYSSTSYDVELIILDSNLKRLDRVLIETPAVQIPLKIELTHDAIYILYQDYEGGDLIHKIVAYDYGLLKILEIDIGGYDSLSLTSFIVNESIVVFGDYVPLDSTNRDFVIIKYDLLGELIMENSFGFSRNEISNNLTSYSDSSFFISGSSNSSFTDDFDAFIGLVRYEDLSIIWRKTLGWDPNVTNRDEFGTNPVIGSNGNIYFGLTTNTYGEGGSDFHCYEFLSNGDYVQGNSFGLPGDEVLEQLSFLSDSSFVFLGNTKVGGGGPSDIFLIKTKNVTFGNEIISFVIEDSTSIVDITTDVDEIESDSKEVLQIIHTENSFQVLAAGNLSQSPSNLLIYNLQGMLVRSNWDKIDLNGLSAGVYILLVQSPNFETISKKFVRF